MDRYCIGIDVGGTSVKFGIFSGVGELLERWSIRTRTAEKGKYILGDIAESVNAKMAEKHLQRNDIIGVGIGIPGPTQSDGYVEVCVNLGWEDINPAKELQAMLGVPVFAGNDANVAALGEMWKGGGEGYRDVVLFTLGTGVGGGVIQNGKILAGHRGLAGELGHITVNPDEPEACNCGNHGCLEQYASATGVARVAAKILRESRKDSLLRAYRHFSAKDVFDAAKKGDELALQAVEILGKYLGQVCATVALTVDPDVFVIGGGVSKAGPILTDVITKYYRLYTPLTEKKVPIVLAELGNDAGIYGAARMALSQ